MTLVCRSSCTATSDHIDLEKTRRCQDSRPTDPSRSDAPLQERPGQGFSRHNDDVDWRNNGLIHTVLVSGTPQGVTIRRSEWSALSLLSLPDQRHPGVLHIPDAATLAAAALPANLELSEWSVGARSDLSDADPPPSMPGTLATSDLRGFQS